MFVTEKNISFVLVKYRIMPAVLPVPVERTIVKAVPVPYPVYETIEKIVHVPTLQEVVLMLFPVSIFVR